MRFTLAFLLLGLMPLAAQRPYSRDLRDRSQDLAPFVASPQPVVDRMLEMAAVKPGELVWDLGCGDGRILITAAQRYKAKAIGVELSQRLVDSANREIQRLNLQEQVTVMQGDLLTVDLKGADVVIIYLETGSNDILRPKLEKSLEPGARVVSHDFEVRGWKPAKVDKIHAYNRNHTIYLYEMPASTKKK